MAKQPSIGEIVRNMLVMNGEAIKLINGMTLEQLRDFIRWCMANHAVKPADVRMWCDRQEKRNA